MLLQLAQILEQLDLALEHLSKGDPSNARFGLMLTDNALELSLHRVAQDEDRQHRRWSLQAVDSYPHRKALEAAKGQDFGAKVTFATLIGKLSAVEAQTVRICHIFRNETYHVGVKHEEILPEVSSFYFKVACGILERLTPFGLGWSSGQVLPERVKKFFSVNRGRSMPGKFGEYETACRQLGQQIKHDPVQFAKTLGSHMAKVIEDADWNLNFISKDAPTPSTRDKVVMDTQAWAIAFSEEGEACVLQKGPPQISRLAAVEWIAQNYPMQFRSDPVPNWQARAVKLRREKDPHLAFNQYRSFIDQTRQFRDCLEDSARALDSEIESQIEAARGK